MLTRVAVPGSRGEHYALTATSAEGMIENAARVARLIEELAAEGLRMQSGVVTPGTQSLRTMAEAYGAVAGDFERRARAMSSSSKGTRRRKAQ